MRRTLLLTLLTLPLTAFSGCGYHTLGAATHLPPNVRTLAIPLFASHTNTYHTETALTSAVLHEFTSRTRLRVVPNESGEPDAILHGTVLQEVATPLTYNSQTVRASSYLLTVVVSVTLTTRDGRILYENKNYVFREQYQSSTDLPRMIDENPAAMERLSRSFAHALVADVLEGL
jgi:outer membrane lipopolysaccharide assembly protein LptE/RlpB